jgi:hypothetical protein
VANARHGAQRKLQEKEASGTRVEDADGLGLADQDDAARQSIIVQFPSAKITRQPAWSCFPLSWRHEVKCRLTPFSFSGKVFLTILVYVQVFGD